MRTYIQLFLLLLFPLLFTSCEDDACCCHKDTYADLTVVNITLNTDMPPYQSLLKQSMIQDIPNTDIRFIITVYTSEGQLQERKTVTASDINQTIYPVNVTFHLPSNTYRLVFWADYVERGSTNDLYYNTQDLKYIVPIGNYMGSTELKDAYTAYKDIDLSIQTDEPVKENVTIKRPFAKYRIIANDFAEYIQNGGTNPEYIRTTIAYTNPMYSSYDAVAGQPGSINAGSLFVGTPQVLSTSELLLGWDYVWAGEDELNLTTDLAISDGLSTKINTINGLKIPCMRNKLTTITGAFLSKKDNSGVGVITEYEGEIDVPLP